ncbi:A-kinase anchor protein 6 isoform X1 [Brienomyrus brachyistius]|uniref:A-kinase anchor protein 6 isoform X1 n=2 Tax=Brienomyrus brachyistius TaxID=42636 RepID=UPI0020B2B097|nr:A-kinase anchor protein 6 isoform X1 [Brienomyrus brachyistius]
MPFHSPTSTLRISGASVALSQLLGSLFFIIGIKSPPRTPLSSSELDCADREGPSPRISLLFTMSIAVSPMASEATSPMITSVTPTVDPSRPVDLEGLGQGDSDGTAKQQDPTQRYQKPPPLHTGADWKVVLHLPEIEAWLRGTTERVRNLTCSVHQDTLNKHVDVHLVQLKDICEDISDHVEQIHALLETEFSLKLLSYSVNIIVDIRSVQLLWHQLRVSVLVLKERLLQSLQDSNGNYTRQTDILQAFSQDHDEARLDALTEVDDSGQLTIKCSQDYFSLDCGITAFELDDYSPAEEAECQIRGLKSHHCFPSLESDFPELIQSVGLLTVTAEHLSSVIGSPIDPQLRCEDSSASQPADTTSTMNCNALQCENTLSKRQLQDSFNCNEMSPTQPSLPKKAMYPEGLSRDDTETILKRAPHTSSLQFQADMSRSTPSLLGQPDRSKFWLELTSIYPNSVRHSCDNLRTMNSRKWKPSRQASLQNLQVSGSDPALQRSSSESGEASDLEHPASPKLSLDPQENCLLDTPQNSPRKNPPDTDSCDSTASPLTICDPTQKIASPSIPEKKRPPTTGGPLKEESWYGSDEYLALPSQLKKTEILALKLETIAKALPQRPIEEQIQDVDDWELSDVHSEWESSTPPQAGCRYEKAFPSGHFSPTSSSDIAPSLDESIESGPLSDLLSEDEVYWHAGECKRTEKPAWSPAVEEHCRHHQDLIKQLLEDIQHQENYKDIWNKIEGFVSKLDEFIKWLREALETTENWLPPKADTTSLKLYLETHLSFKLNVDSHCSLKDGVLEEGKQLLEVIISHKSGLRDTLQTIAHQWQQLQRQIRRQHSWILRALDSIKAQMLASQASQEVGVGAASPQKEVQWCQDEAQRAALDQMSLKLNSQLYCADTKRRTEFVYMSSVKFNSSGSNSLSDFELEYQDLWDWLTDMESTVTDSHELMMSVEQRQHLYKGSILEIGVWDPRKSQLLDRVQSLHRSGVQLPADFDERVSALTQKWNKLEATLGELAKPPSSGSPAQLSPALLSPETTGMLRQLETRIKELKGWLRDTELLIFNSCLRQELQDDKQLQYFKSLCSEVRGRRRGVASVLRLCQKLLEEQEPAEAESERQALQLLMVNLERRWEAIVMQALQWQTHLQRALGTEQVPGNIIEPAFMHLHGTVEDSWEWDEMDISNDLISVDGEPQNHASHQCHNSTLSRNSTGNNFEVSELNQNNQQNGVLSQDIDQEPLSPHSNIYHVYSLHRVELYNQPQYTFQKKAPTDLSNKQPLTKSVSKDSSFSSAESIPELFGGIISIKQGGDSLYVHSARRSESESGIMSEGDTETITNSENCLLSQLEDSQGSLLLTPPKRGHSPSHSQVYEDNDINRILECAKKCVLYEDCDRSLLESKNKSEAVKKVIDESAQTKGKQGKNPEDILTMGLDAEELDPIPFTTSPSDEKGTIRGKCREGFASVSPGSSLDSLFVAGDLFLSSKDTLHRSTSLESWLAPCKSAEDIGSQHSLGDLGLAAGSTGELSKRTLELLKRLENIQTPLVQKMTRSISDITLQSSSLRFPGPGQPSVRLGSSINESSAPSLTELSTTEESSVASEDIAVQRNCLVDLNDPIRKQFRSQLIPDEADASISMVVNVSCTSACTDDEDDSDLLSSSTLTLTEEELGIKDDEDSSIASDEEYIEGSFALGLDYIKNELQNWIKPRSQSKEKNELDLGDELQCGTLTREKVPSTLGANRRRFLSRSALKLFESNAHEKNISLQQEDADAQKREVTRNYMRQFADDMENGNVENSQVKKKDEDDEFLREERSLFTKSGESFKDCYALNTAISDTTVAATKTELCDLVSSQAKESVLEGQLSGEIPCYSSGEVSLHKSSVEGCTGSHQCATAVLHENHPEENHVSFPKDTCERHQLATAPQCCSHLPPSPEEEKTEDVHNFVMEIIDMTAVALKNKETQADQEGPCPTPVAQIRDKVLEHSHRSIQLRKGDFYSYLSLSSHDSDCGEVNTCMEDKSSSPPLPKLRETLEIHDKELLFEACTEEVYLGPPLCYSMCMSQKVGRKFPSSRDCSSPHTEKDQALPSACPEYQKAPVISPGSTAGSLLEYHNEAAYLNPLPCETLIDTVECFADTKMLESNISPVMTKIRVSCSSTNPLKEDGSLYINPKINCPQIRKCDRDEKGPASLQMKQKNARKGCSSHPETKSTHKQMPKPEQPLAEDGRGPPGRSAASARSISSASQHHTSTNTAQKNKTSRPLAKRGSGYLVPPITQPQL